MGRATKAGEAPPIQNKKRSSKAACARGYRPCEPCGLPCNPSVWTSILRDRASRRLVQARQGSQGSTRSPTAPMRAPPAAAPRLSGSPAPRLPGSPAPRLPGSPTPRLPDSPAPDSPTPRVPTPRLSAPSTSSHAASHRDTPSSRCARTVGEFKTKDVELIEAPRRGSSSWPRRRSPCRPVRDFRGMARRPEPAARCRRIRLGMAMATNDSPLRPDQPLARMRSGAGARGSGAGARESVQRAGSGRCCIQVRGSTGPNPSGR